MSSYRELKESEKIVREILKVGCGDCGAPLRLAYGIGKFSRLAGRRWRNESLIVDVGIFFSQRYFIDLQCIADCTLARKIPARVELTREQFLRVVDALPDVERVDIFGRVKK